MRRPTPGVRLKNTGFTLLELLVVLVLAAITVSVVGGGAQSFMERARYHQTVRDVATHLKQARTLCIQDGRPVAVTYDPSTRHLTVDGHSPMDFPSVGPRTLQGPGRFSLYSMPTGVPVAVGWLSCAEVRAWFFT